MTRAFRFRASGVAALLGVGALSFIPADASSSRLLHLDAHLRGEQDLVASSRLCDAYGLTGNGTTQAQYSGVSTYTGNVDGTGAFCGLTDTVPDASGNLPFDEVDTFTGHIAGCGSGSFTYDVRGVTEPGNPNPAAAALGAHETWVIRAGTGTGAFTGMTGSGADPAQVNVLPTVHVDAQAPAPTTSVEAHFLGAVRCPGRDTGTPAAESSDKRQHSQMRTVPIDGGFSGTNNAYSLDPSTGDVLLAGYETDTGNWSTEGNADTYTGRTRPNPSTGNFEFWATHRISGTITGCGTGTFTLSEHGYASAPADPTAGGAHVHATWTIDPGSGGGGLSDLRSGTGTYDYTFANSFKDGHTKGTVSCQPWPAGDN